MMKPSPLQLDHYVFSEIFIKPIPDIEPVLFHGYPSMESANFSSEVEVRPVGDDEAPVDGIQRYAIHLTLNCEPKDKETPKFPYYFRVGVLGIFNGPIFPEEKREALIVVNGASVLFGAIREQLMTLSARTMGPTLMLPLVKFDEIGEQIMAKRSAAQQKATPAVK